MIKQNNVSTIFSDSFEESFPLHRLAYYGNKTTLKKFLLSYKGLVDVRDPCGRTPLMYAAMVDNHECSVSLIKNEADLHAKDNIGRTAIHWAADNGSIKCLKLLLAFRADYKLRDRHGITILHLSSVLPTPHCLKLVIEYCSPEEVDVQDNDKRTALHWSACSGNVQSIKLLLKYNCNIGIPDVKGMTPLHWAAISEASSAPECVRYLLRNQPSVLNWGDNDGKTAFHLAVVQNARDVVQEMISCQYQNIDVSDNEGCTPLHLACLFGLSDSVNLLLNHNARINSKDEDEATPLHYAAASNSVEILKILLLRNVDINFKDKNGRSAVAWAISKGADDTLRLLISSNACLKNINSRGSSAVHLSAAYGFQKIVKIVLESGLSINEVDSFGRTPLFDACNSKSIAMVEYLVRRGAVCPHIDKHGQTPLHCAAAKGCPKICHFLISNGCFIDAIDNWGRTPLLHAAYGNHTKCINDLFEYGANLHHCDYENFNSLHWASQRGHLETVELLLKYGVNPNIKSKNRLTALDCACIQDHHSVTHYLLESGALSMFHIENMAAAKIQKAYRNFKFRNTGKFKSTRILPQETNLSSLENLTKPPICNLNSFSNEKNWNQSRQYLPKFKKSIHISKPSKLYTASKEANVSEHSFNFLQTKTVKSINLNRKTELGHRKRCTSMLNISINDRSTSDSFSTNKKNVREKSSSLLALYHSDKESGIQKSALKNYKKRNVTPERTKNPTIDGKSFNYLHIFDRFIKSSFDTSPSHEAINYKNFKEIFKLPADQQDHSEYNLFRKAFRHPGEQEWLNSLGDAVFEECQLIFKSDH